MPANANQALDSEKSRLPQFSLRSLWIVITLLALALALGTQPQFIPLVALVLVSALWIVGLVYGWAWYERSLDGMRLPMLVRLLLTLLGQIAFIAATPITLALLSGLAW